MKIGKLFWRINEQIHAPQLRVIGSDGKQIAIMDGAEALLAAKKAGLDLVEIAPTANPPVAKIVNIGKFKYQEEKRLRARLKKEKASGLKEVRFSPFIAEYDYNIRLGKIKEFLQEKHKVKAVVVFKGRQMGSRRFGYEILKKILDNLGGLVAVDMEPKFMGRYLTMIISPRSARRRTSEQAIGNK